MKNKILLPLLMVLSPLVASAAFSGISGYVTDIGGIVNLLTKVVVAAALLVFFWGLVKFIAKAGDEAAVEEGRRLMLWGIVALFVMLSVWGLVLFLQTQLSIFGGGTPPIPQFPTP